MAAVPTTSPTPAAVVAHDLYERYGRQIFAFCVHRLGSREEAEDAVQSTFLNAFRSLQRGVEPRVESAWLFKIAENVCLTRLRSTSRRRRLESPTDLHALQDVVPSRSGESDELFNLPEALARMPQSQRRALLLREWHGLSYAEIARELSLSQSAVETLLFRARRSLARGLEQPPAPEPRPRLRRARAGELGSVFTVLKTLLVGGGVKVAATVATVAATSVAVTPPARHEVEHAVRDGAKLVAARPAPGHVAPKQVVRKPAAAVLAARVAASQPAMLVAAPKVRHEPRPVPAKRQAARHPVRVVAHVTRPKRHAPPRHAGHEPRLTVVHAPPAPAPPPAVVEHHRAEVRVEKHERSPKPTRVEQAAAKPEKSHATREKPAAKHESAPVEAPKLAEAKVSGAHEAKEPRLPKQHDPVAPVVPQAPDEHPGKAHAEKTPKAADEPHGGRRSRDDAAIPTEAVLPPAEVPVAAAPPDAGAVAPPPGEPASSRGSARAGGRRRGASSPSPSAPG